MVNVADWSVHVALAVDTLKSDTFGEAITGPEKSKSIASRNPSPFVSSVPARKSSFNGLTVNFTELVLVTMSFPFWNPSPLESESVVLTFVTDPESAETEAYRAVTMASQGAHVGIKSKEK